MDIQNFCTEFHFTSLYEITFTETETLIINDFLYNNIYYIKVYRKSSVFNGKCYYYVLFRDLPNMVKILAYRLNAVSKCEPAEPNKCYLSRLIYVLYTNKPIPQGHEIHHVNNNSLDNTPTNLECLSREDHMARHNYKNPLKDKYFTIDELKPAKRQKPHYKAKENKIIELIKQGKSNRHIIKTLKCHNSTIQKVKATLEKLENETCETLKNVKNKILNSRAFHAIVNFKNLVHKHIKQGVYKPLLHVFNTS